MASIQTLEEISEARGKVYDDLAVGKIDDKRAMTIERVLRGQTELKAAVPLRALAIVAKARNPNIGKHGERLMKALLKFTTGEEIPPDEGDAAQIADK